MAPRLLIWLRTCLVYRFPGFRSLSVSSCLLSLFGCSTQMKEYWFNALVWKVNPKLEVAVCFLSLALNRSQNMATSNSEASTWYLGCLIKCKSTFKFRWVFFFPPVMCLYAKLSSLPAGTSFIFSSVILILSSKTHEWVYFPKSRYSFNAFKFDSISKNLDWLTKITWSQPCL